MNKPTEEELTYIASIRDKRRYSPQEVKDMFDLYNRLHGTKDKPTTCGRCIARKHSALLKIYKDNKNG